ncbi:MAG: hypothetical protein DCF25_21580 [Leptolyngbya foveolarum]|uniref:Antibiotic biosynthesis monooxygenase n=1 Tax=Leptolyngbya foveolarum TaxID=47253 RepID=A0A2W4TPH3_9CYAN|nr:MAG: hypothetical protein DCF25_21580 [Leptolyngbya foveolarum]
MVSSDVAQKSQESQAFYSSLVVEHIVAKVKTVAFERWYSVLIQAAERHPGFVRADLNAPLFCEDDVVKWYSIVHFNSPENLSSWVASKDRQEIFEKGQTILRAYRFKSFTTGLEGWFSRRTDDGEQRGLGPPAWKQILSVVFGLYPIVMVRIKLLPNTGVIGDWSPSGAMLLATLVTSAILAVVVMPVVTRLMGFWLYPAYRKSKWKADVLGAIVMGLGLVFMAGVFDRI